MNERGSATVEYALLFAFTVVMGVLCLLLTRASLDTTPGPLFDLSVISTDTSQ